MSDKTAIEWTDATWNPVTGCTKVSPGCDHCYPETFAERWRGTPGHYYENGFDVQLRPNKLDQPLRWRKPRRIFVNSMSDLDMVNHPPHYNAHPSGVECIEVTRLMPFTTGNAVKYIWRADLKNGVEDLRKARWYLRDHRANGLSGHPPWKARALLDKVIEADPNPHRAQMLYLIAYGHLEDVIAIIDTVVGVGE